MKTISIYCYLFLLVFLSGEYSFGQDMNYTQYFSNPIYYNPAFTGLNPGLRARFVYRDQWPSLPIPFKSYDFSADIGDRNLPGAGGIGLLVNRDSPGIGLINSLTVGLTFSVRIPLASFLTSQIGIKAAMLQRNINWDDMLFAGQLDAKYGAIYQSTFTTPDANKRTVPDFAAGGILQFSTPDGNVTGNAGVSVDHLFKPDISFFENQSAHLPDKLVIHGDVTIETAESGTSGSSHSASEPLKINIGAIYENQDNLDALQVGFNVLKFNLYLGAWYRNTISSPSPNSILAVLAGYRFTFAENMSIRFMYSYDIQISGALQGTGGAHEISLILDFDNFSLFKGSGNRSGYIIPNNHAHGNSSPLECSDF